MTLEDIIERFIGYEDRRLLHELLLEFHLLKEQNKAIIMTQAEELALLQALKVQNEKAKGEILAKIATLETAVANAGNTSPEVDAALADLKTSIQSTDDIVPDPAPAPVV